MTQVPTFQEIRDLLEESRKLFPVETQLQMLCSESEILKDLMSLKDANHKTVFYLTHVIESRVEIITPGIINSLDQTSSVRLTEIGQKVTEMGQAIVTYLDETKTH